jgi:hypothetical protein
MEGFHRRMDRSRPCRRRETVCGPDDAKGVDPPKGVLVAPQENRLTGRGAHWALPKIGKPVLLDLPWEHERHLSIGTHLLQETLTLMKVMGVDQIGYVVDTPQKWQRFPDQRMRLLHRGFALERTTRRFEGRAKKSPLFLSFPLRRAFPSDLPEEVRIWLFPRKRWKTIRPEKRRNQGDREKGGTSRRPA